MTLRRLIAALLMALLPATVAAQTPVYEGFHDVRTAGGDTAYMRGLTHRYVNGELRFLSLTHRGALHEFRLASNITSTTGTWQIPSAAFPEGNPNNGFQGIWFDQAKNRLWIVGAEDYNADNRNAKVTLLQLGASGSITTLKSFFIAIPEKRVYGGCNAVPAALVAQLGGPYVCGWGGYTSLRLQGGNNSIGLTMYAIPDPDGVANGGTVTPRTIADHAKVGDGAEPRGRRRTIPENDYDEFESPGPDGLGYQVWGDSYYNTGMWIGTNFVAILSACEGRCWYQNSTLNHEGRQFEWHLWNGAQLTGANRQPVPAVMTELDLNRANTWAPEGNVTTGNIAGATYVTETGHMFMVGYPMGASDSGRIFRFGVGAGTGQPPTPTPVDAMLSAWSAWTGDAWSACSNGTQTRQETRTRTVVTPASNGGSTGPLSETRTASQSCTVTPPPPVTMGAPTGVMSPPTCSLVLGYPSGTRTPDGVTSGWSVQFQRDGVNIGTRDTSSPFSRTVSVPLGRYTFTAVWTKSGRPTVTSAGTLQVCE